MQFSPCQAIAARGKYADHLLPLSLKLGNLRDQHQGDFLALPGVLLLVVVQGRHPARPAQRLFRADAGFVFPDRDWGSDALLQKRRGEKKDLFS